ncbi:hypothetical protein CRENBAI_014214 [Crenichthys baileyi]|uniref:Uncharacterized protein n=1 Tax=Crenichthys baileyi TaxID=28760 RepID=A0AAV9QQX2_9TELE
MSSVVFVYQYTAILLTHNSREISAAHLPPLQLPPPPSPPLFAFSKIQVCRTPETTYQASNDSNPTLDKPLPSCLASRTSSEPAYPLSNALRILDSDPVTVELTTRTTPLKPKQETTLTNRHIVESGTHLLLELKDSWMWIHSPGNSHPKISKPPSCHSHSPSRTWNTKLPQRRNHLPPGYPLLPPPSLLPSQEPSRPGNHSSHAFLAKRNLPALS